MTSLKLAPVLLLGFLFHHHDARKEYAATATSVLAHYAAQVGDYAHHPPLFTSEKDDALYVTRAELDIHIAQVAIKVYALGKADQSVVDEAIRQLQRDIEDEPEPVVPKI